MVYLLRTTFVAVCGELWHTAYKTLHHKTVQYDLRAWLPSVVFTSTTQSHACLPTMMQALVLNGNSVGDDGARYLMNALRANQSLKYLGLQGTNMTSASRGHGGSSEFNPLAPDGTYTLDLSQAPDRAAAAQLAAIDASSASDLMKNIRLNDRSVSSAKAAGWPARSVCKGMVCQACWDEREGSDGWLLAWVGLSLELGDDVVPLTAGSQLL